VYPKVLKEALTNANGLATLSLQNNRENAFSDILERIENIEILS